MKVRSHGSSFGNKENKAGEEYKPKSQEISRVATKGGKCLKPHRNPKHNRLQLSKETYVNMEKREDPWVLWLFRIALGVAPLRAIWHIETTKSHTQSLLFYVSDQQSICLALDKCASVYSDKTTQ